MGKKSRRNKGHNGAKGEEKVRMPTGGQQNLDNISFVNMIFYPEVGLGEDESPSGASVRGAVGHEPMHEVMMNVFDSRLQKHWTQCFDAGDFDRVFEDFTPMLLALQDAGMAQNLNESHRAESTTLRSNEMKLQSQYGDLEDRLDLGEESFLFIPLEAFYCNLPHALIDGMMIGMGIPPNMRANVMKGYKDVKVWTHKKGPCCGGTKPPDSDLVGPHEFTRGLRFQCGMTATLASMCIYALLKVTKASPNDVFIFPHALVFSSKDGDFNEIIQAIGFATPSIYHRSQDLWYTAGKHTSVLPMNFPLPWDGAVQVGSPGMLQPGDEPVTHAGNEQFMKIVEESGCSWYPLFSESLDDRLNA
jgi:hypothetical protein